jgi:TolB-like protein/Tfp pilus assembly protein PilF
VARHDLVERWIALAPFDPRPHAILLETLVRAGRIREAEEHLAAAARLFEADGLDLAPLRAAWKAARALPVGAAVASEPPRSEPPGFAATAHRRASIAVLPFAVAPGDAIGGGIAHGIVHDVISRMAKLRSLRVIARGSVFSLAARGIDVDEAGRLLGADYVLTGEVASRNERVRLAVELVDRPTGAILWIDVFEHRTADTLGTLDAIGSRIVAHLVAEIDLAERNRAILKPPGSLDAWETFHLGLGHMYRFTATDNAEAQRHFRAAIQMDPTFARAHAGLSFTHFQNAFLHRADARASEVQRAFDAAGKAVLADTHDPAARLALGRALWLSRRDEAAVEELRAAVELSPGFALAHYTLSFVTGQVGDPAEAIAAAETARQLSPFDPLLHAMLSVRAMCHFRLGEFDDAATWAARAAAQPNAHAHILAIAAYCHAAAERLDEARALRAALRKMRPDYDIETMIGTFHFGDDTVAELRRSARRIG